ncbi:hypothetical protein VTO42DRAFT_75 [Malbranchea cinnamomea]
MDALEVLRGGFLLTACAILAINNIPAFRRRFIFYGPRAVSSPTKSSLADKAPTPRKDSWVELLLDRIATWNVPHSYFIHFYIVSVISSTLWGIQLATRGPLFRAVASTINRAWLSEYSMSCHQIVLCWALLALQGVRRLYECFALTKPSTSKMWFGHWLFGLAFYISMGIAIWIEGTGALLSSDISLGDIRIVAPSLKTMLFLPVFLIASGIQHDCHCYLASLKKYTLPEHPAFVRIICPHYTAECAIYLSLSVLAAPKGSLVNKTIFSGFILAVINLGVSAGTTKEWYIQKFGNDKVQNKWRMIPRLY